MQGFFGIYLILAVGWSLTGAVCGFILFSKDRKRGLLYGFVAGLVVGHILAGIKAIQYEPPSVSFERAAK